MKKIILTLSLSATVIAPLAAMISCSSQNTNDDFSEVENMGEIEITSLSDAQAILTEQVAYDISQVTPEEFKANTEWKVGKSAIEASLGLSLPKISTSLHIRAKYVESSSSFNTSDDETAMIEIEVSDKDFTIAESDNIEKVTLPVTISSNSIRRGIGAVARTIRKAFSLSKKSKLTASELLALSDEDKLSFEKLGIEYTAPEGYTIQITNTQIKRHGAYRGAMVFLDVVIEKEGQQIVLSKLLFASKDFKVNLRIALDALAESFQEQINLKKVDTLPSWKVGDTIQQNDARKVITEFRTLQGLLLIQSHKMGFRAQVSPLKITEVNDAYIKFDVSFFAAARPLIRSTISLKLEKNTAL